MLKWTLKGRDSETYLNQFAAFWSIVKPDGMELSDRKQYGFDVIENYGENRKQVRATITVIPSPHGYDESTVTVSITETLWNHFFPETLPAGNTKTLVTIFEQFRTDTAPKPPPDESNLQSHNPIPPNPSGRPRTPLYDKAYEKLCSGLSNSDTREWYIKELVKPENKILRPKLTDTDIANLQKYLSNPDTQDYEPQDIYYRVTQAYKKAIYRRNQAKNKQKDELKT